jgi:hypothetical protein
MSVRIIAVVRTIVVVNTHLQRGRRFQVSRIKLVEKAEHARPLCAFLQRYGHRKRSLAVEERLHGRRSVFGLDLFFHFAAVSSCGVDIVRYSS